MRLRIYHRDAPFVYIDYFHVKSQYYATGLLFGLHIIGIVISFNVMNTKLVSRLGAMKMISIASFVSVIAALAVAMDFADGIRRLVVDSHVPVLRRRRGRFAVGQLHDGTDASLSEERGRGGRRVRRNAARFGRLASLAAGFFHDVSPHGMGIVIGVCGVLTVAGRTLALRSHAAPVKV